MRHKFLLICAVSVLSMSQNAECWRPSQQLAQEYESSHSPVLIARDGQELADAVAAFGYYGNDTVVIVQPEEDYVPLDNTTFHNLPPTASNASRRWYSTGSLTIIGSSKTGGKVLIDARMRANLSGMLSGTAKLNIANIAWINLCELVVEMDYKDKDLVFISTLDMGLFPRGNNFLSHSFNNVTMYGTAVDNAVQIYMGIIQKTPFARVRAMSAELIQDFPDLGAVFSDITNCDHTVVSYRLPSAMVTNSTFVAIELEDDDEHVMHLRETGRLIPPTWCENGTALTSEHRHAEVEPSVGPLFRANNDTHFVYQLQRAAVLAPEQVMNKYPTAAVMITEAACLNTSVMPPPGIYVNGPLLLWGKVYNDPLNIQYTRLDLAYRYDVLNLGPGGQLFVQQIQFTNLATQPTTKDGAASLSRQRGTGPQIELALPDDHPGWSAFPLMAIHALSPPSNVTADTAPIMMHQVILELPLDDYLTLAAIGLKREAAFLDMKALGPHTQASLLYLQQGVRDMGGAALTSDGMQLNVICFQGFNMAATIVSFRPARALNEQQQRVLQMLLSSEHGAGQGSSSLPAEGKLALAISFPLFFVLCCAIGGIAIWARKRRVSYAPTCKSTDASRSRAPPDVMKQLSGKGLTNGIVVFTDSQTTSASSRRSCTDDETGGDSARIGSVTGPAVLFSGGGAAAGSSLLMLVRGAEQHNLGQAGCESLSIQQVHHACLAQTAPVVVDKEASSNVNQPHCKQQGTGGDVSCGGSCGVKCNICVAASKGVHASSLRDGEEQCSLAGYSTAFTSTTCISFNTSTSDKRTSTDTRKSAYAGVPSINRLSFKSSGLSSGTAAAQGSTVIQVRAEPSCAVVGDHTLGASSAGCGAHPKDDDERMMGTVTITVEEDGHADGVNNNKPEAQSQSQSSASSIKTKIKRAMTATIASTRFKPASGHKQHQHQQQDTGLEQHVDNNAVCDGAAGRRQVVDAQLLSLSPTSAAAGADDAQDSASAAGGSAMHSVLSTPPASAASGGPASNSSNHIMLNTTTSPAQPGSPANAGNHFKAMIASKSNALTAGDKVVVQAVIGKGSWGTVYCGQWRGLPCAVKTLIFQLSPEEQRQLAAYNAAAAAQVSGRGISGLQALAVAKQAGGGHFSGAVMEAAIAASVGHRNLVCCYCYDIKEMNAQHKQQGALTKGLTIDEAYKRDSSDGDKGILKDYKLYLIQELCGTSLAHALAGDTLLDAATGQVNPMLATVLILDIAQGLDYLHSHAIIHGDLKPANVLLKTDKESPIGVVAKLADFGLSSCLPDGATHVSGWTSGTPFYVAPEVVQERKTSIASDCYSLGVIMWQMATGQTPYVVQAGGQFVPNPAFGALVGHNTMPYTFISIMLKCLLRDPRQRPTASQVVTSLTDMLQGHAQRESSNHNNSNNMSSQVSRSSQQGATAPMPPPQPQQQAPIPQHTQQQYHQQLMQPQQQQYRTEAGVVQQQQQQHMTHEFIEDSHDHSINMNSMTWSNSNTSDVNASSTCVGGDSYVVRSSCRFLGGLPTSTSYDDSPAVGSPAVVNDVDIKRGSKAVTTHASPVSDAYWVGGPAASPFFGSM